MPSYTFTDEERAAARQAVETPMQRIARLRAELEEPVAPTAPSDQAAESIRPQLGAHTYRQLAGAAAIVAVMVLGAFLAFRGGAAPAPATTTRATTTTDDRRPTTDQPTSGPPVAQLDAYAAPDGARLGPIPADSALAYRDSAHPGWAGVRHDGAVVWVKAEPPATARDLAPPTPAPTVERVYVPVAPPCDPAVNPAYSVQEDVYSASGVPLGQVTGVSCDSQADAQRNADQRAAELRAAQPTAAPEPTKTAIVPRPPTNRPKPMQPPVNQDSGQSNIEIALWAAGWPIASVKGVISW